MPRGPGRNGYRWRRLRAQVIAESVTCHLCGQPLDKTAPHHTPGSVTVDHIVSLIEGGHPTDRANLAAAHLGCNAVKENARRRQRALNRSRDW